MYGKSNAIVKLGTALALGSTEEVLSSAYQYTASNYNTRIIVYANTEVTITAEDTLYVDLKECSTTDGTYANVAAALRLTAPTGDTVYAIGDVIAEIVIPDMIVTSGYFLKVGITDAADLTAMKVDIEVTNCY